MGFIYLIRNTKNGKCYIGQTRQRVTQRWSDHKKNKESVISRAFARHGLDAFEFSVICEIPNEELNDREILEIKERNTLAPNGYNIQSGGGNREMSEETKQRIGAATSKALKGRKMTETVREALKKANTGRHTTRTEELRQRDREVKRDAMKPVDQYALDGTFVKTWESVKSTKVNGVRQCCSLSRKTAGGFVWRWKGVSFDAKPSEEQVQAERAKVEANRTKVNAQRRVRRRAQSSATAAQ